MPITWPIAAIGAFAAAALATDQSARVAGVTSRGLFVQAERGDVVFLSSEPQRGPLTLNLPEGIQPPNIAPGSAARVRGGKRIELSGGLALDFAAAPVWSPAPPVGRWQGQAGMQSAIRAVLDETTRAGRAIRYLPWLNPALGWQPEPSAHADTLAMRRLARALAGLDDLGDSARPFLGAGSGLTPAGDDLLAGALLALRRWGSALFPTRLHPDPAPLLALAREKTTTLSAALLACAAAGQADERLVTALDGLVTGSPGASACARTLLDWGSTSGVEAFAGMALFLAGQSD